jgi:citrate synthase
MTPKPKEPESVDFARDFLARWQGKHVGPQTAGFVRLAQEYLALVADHEAHAEK